VGVDRTGNEPRCLRSCSISISKCKALVSIVLMPAAFRMTALSPGTVCSSLARRSANQEMLKKAMRASRRTI
jgi:hypothetical protein